MSFRSRRRHTRTVAGPLGPVRVQYDRWLQAFLVVDGPGMPTVGLRMPDALAVLTVDGAKVPISHPGDWTLRRRSRRIRTTVASRTYELRPIGARRSRLYRDGTVVADARGGWSAYAPIHLLFPGRNADLTWRPACDPTDVAVGHALVLGYGAGSPGALINLAWAILTFWS